MFRAKSSGEGRCSKKQASSKEKKKKKEKKNTTSQVKLAESGKMRSALEVVHRILWDDSLPTDAFIIGYLDRFVGIVEKGISAFNFQEDISTLSHLEFSIPQHRIQYIKYYSEIVWDKRPESRHDSVFGTYAARNSKGQEGVRRIEDFLQDPNLRSIAVLGPEEAECPQVSSSVPTAVGNPNRPNYFICCRVLSPKVKAFAESLQNSDKDLQKAALNSERFHFTVITLKLRNELEVERAKDALLSFELSSVIDPEQPLKIHGVDNFRGRVVYAGLDKTDGSYAKMVFLHEKLRNHFISKLGTKCWIGQDRDFVPHMTISKMTRAMSREGKFFHEFSLSRYNNVTLGMTKVRALHLCKMEPPADPNSFYQVAGSKLNVSPILCHPYTIGMLFPEGFVGSNGPEKTALKVSLALSAAAKQVKTPTPLCSCIIVRGCKATTRQYVKREYANRQPKAFTVQALEQQSPLIVVESNHAKRWHYELCVKLAKVNGYNIQVVEVSAPLDTSSGSDLVDILEMKDNWENDPASTCIPLYPEIKHTLSKKQLYVFDMDRTLLQTPDPKGISRLTGCLWVTLPWSLDFENSCPGPAILEYRQAARRGDAFVVVLTGRKESLRGPVSNLLQHFNISPDCLVLKKDPSVPTAKYKAKSVSLLVESGLFESCAFFDDDYNSLVAVEEALDNSAFANYTLHDANLLGRINHQQGFPTLEMWVREQLAGVIKTNTGVCIPVDNLSMQFGSFPLGRLTSDLDLCLFAPYIGDKNVLEMVYERVRKGGLASPPSPFGIKDSHFSKRSRCPRISLLVQNGSMQYELDLVMGTMDIDFFTDRFSTNVHVTEKFMLDCMEACRANDQASIKSFTGPLLLVRVTELLEACGLSKENFVQLLERAISLLETARLRGAHFQMVKTFQVVLLLEEYIRFTGGRGISFIGLCNFLGRELPKETWANILRGIYHDNVDNFASCNLAFMESIISAFQNPQSAPYNFSERCKELDLFHVEVVISTSRPWKAKIQLEAGFPSVLRRIQANHAYFLADGSSLIVGSSYRFCDSTKQIKQGYTAPRSFYVEATSRDKT
mmetsp:Transcript_17097/g.29376  ORF Transcript_17097/g.29376 Transcript_17097/m.29376 type:complete len:1067 (+) Transcript_17097:87-3287(+)|eukprot:CAMPEP_0203757848 /NCGR_PEP_ID=MMETSP0098-20131031/10720_1 /ASSEMBLY_ACC=CAM_ASM_000208 /TAXON_ID=96639 /ORGANISM=" , Strain NY0313808BC1" /LENGTH=1066 /DNA_ID=CAMNT_0050650091 /DNA_START=59 /DNA_END=3259 /DNA_ORIENTATION=-